MGYCGKLLDIMFVGEYNHNLDTKGRVIIPSKFRDLLGKEFILTRWLDKSLFAFPMENWHKFENKINDMPFNSRDARAFSRLILSGANDINFDKQGRINIPTSLIKHAELEKKITIIGSGKGIEIWDKNNWEKYLSDYSENFEDISENILDFD